MDGDLGEAGKRTERNFLDTGLGGGSQRHGIAITTQTSIDPQNMNQCFFCFDCSLGWHLCSSLRDGLESLATGVDLRPTCER